MVAKRCVPSKEGISECRTAQTARTVALLPFPIRKGSLTLHVSVLPFVLPVGSIYHRGDDRKGETVENTSNNFLSLERSS